MNFEELTFDQQAKARACESPEELLAYARAEGYELSDEDLEHVSGGWGDSLACPQCGSSRISYDSYLSMRICQDCGYEF